MKDFQFDQKNESANIFEPKILKQGFEGIGSNFFPNIQNFQPNPFPAFTPNAFPFPNSMMFNYTLAQDCFHYMKNLAFYNFINQQNHLNMQMKNFMEQSQNQPPHANPFINIKKEHNPMK